MAVIEVDGLTKRYGEVAACDGIAFHVEAGECVALLGPNGAGKTTTVEILEGYRARDAGAVSVLGVDPAHPTLAWRRRIGIVLQSATDVAELTVAEVVEHFARYYPNGRDPAEVIEAVGLEAKRDARTRALSGGQRRRLDVALGILGRPDLLFLDEPTTGFDPAARRDFWSLIDGLKADGTTIVLTTHYLEEAEVLADRVVVIVDGSVAATGTPTQLGGGGDEVTVAWRDTDGHRQEVVTSTPTLLVSELAGRFGGEVPDLEVRRPTLEDVYLRIIARKSA
jgi:ABC-2 type transport system ATP-binding protein